MRHVSSGVNICKSRRLIQSLPSFLSALVRILSCYLCWLCWFSSFAFDHGITITMDVYSQTRLYLEFIVTLSRLTGPATTRTSQTRTQSKSPESQGETITAIIIHVPYGNLEPLPP
jgi:hypothetical protein